MNSNIDLGTDGTSGPRAAALLFASAALTRALPEEEVPAFWSTGFVGMFLFGMLFLATWAWGQVLLATWI